MLKYVDTKVTFFEVPEEISLCINISNCPCHCEGCHSSYLAEDIGKVLDIETLDKLIEANKGITCVAFMGGDSNPEEINRLAKHVFNRQHLKVCWYSGRDILVKEIDLDYFDYIKLGSYMKEKGPLSSLSTNQRFYRVGKMLYRLEDVTYKFLRKEL